MPDEKSAVNALWSAYQRLKELGWKEYHPKDVPFVCVEPGSSGIHECFAMEPTEPLGRVSYWSGGEMWPMRPVLFRAQTPPERLDRAEGGSHE